MNAQRIALATRTARPVDHAAQVDQAWREMQTAPTDAAYEAAKQRYINLTEGK